MIKPHILEIFCYSDSLIIWLCSIQNLYFTWCLIAKWGEPKWAGNTIYNTIQVAMETMFFFITQISVSLKKNPIVFRGFQSTIYDPSIFFWYFAGL